MSILDNLYANTLGQHFDNTGNLRAATRQGLISEPQYKTMSGYDASQTIPGITDNPVVTGAASGAYNIAKSIFSPEDYFNPDTYQPRIGPIDSTVLNTLGSLGLSPQDKEKYEGIVSLDPKSLGIGQWSEEDLTDFSGVYDDDETGILDFQLQKNIMNKKAVAQAAMQKQIQQAEAAQAAAAQAAAARQVRQNIQTYGSGDRPNIGMNRPGGGRGQSPTGGDVQGTPFNMGGLARLLYYGGLV